MESYAPLLEKTRVPQPSLQKFAVISIFSKLRSAPKYLDPYSDPGRDAITQCLNSYSPSIVDQSIRELCLLVKDSRIDISRGLLELQAALEGTDPKFVGVFVKGLGFLVRFGFQENNGFWKFSSTEMHPFVKVLSCRREVQSELLQQVLLFMIQNKGFGLIEVCEFLRPFVEFSTLRIPFSDSASYSFANKLMLTMASFCCSFPSESIPVFNLLIGSLKYLPFKNFEDFGNLMSIVESVVDTYIVVLKLLVGKQLHSRDFQLSGIELLETILSLSACLHGQLGGNETIIELSRRLLSVQLDLGLQYIPELSSILISLFVILVQSNLEHEQLSILKLLLCVLKWKYENGFPPGRIGSTPFEEFLFILPVISLMSSPSKSVKGRATTLLVMIEKHLVKQEIRKDKLALEEKVSCLSTPGCIVFRLFQHIWHQDQDSLSSIPMLNVILNVKSEGKIMVDKITHWVSLVREYCLSIVGRRKSSEPLSPSHEVFVKEMPLLLSAVAGALVMHPSFGAAAVDSLAAIAIMDPKLAVSFLLTILFYNNLFTRKDVVSNDMLLKLLGLLPSLASHFATIQLVVKTILPMLNKDAKSTLYATAVRLLCQTWEINDRAFGSLQGVLLPKRFTEFSSDKNVCISMAASIWDVCNKNPDRGVDLILSVSACIESQDTVVKALGFQSLAHLCEADVIDFYTAWDVIAKYARDHYVDPVLAQSYCLLLRWGAMDAEAYPEASKDVIQILWGIATLTHHSHVLQWAKARTSALEALSQYEVSHINKCIPDFKEKNLEFFFSDTNLEVLRAVEDFQVKIITYEHINRRRLVKGKKIVRSKIDKLLNVFPQVIFSSGKTSEARELPAAALFCLTPKTVNSEQARKLQDVNAGYVNALKEIAASLQLSRNIFVALITLQSWKSFMQRWMRAYILLFEAKPPSKVLDKSSKAANDILKRMIGLAEEALPSSAENITLAIGALCVVLPPSAHTVKSAASKFLLDWLHQHAHEHRQWVAAISLGLITTCLHVTDHKQRYQNIAGLLEVLGCTKSVLVKGSCGVGLGFSCQDLLTRVEAVDNSDVVGSETDKVPESELLGRIVKTLSTMLCHLNQSSAILESLCSNFAVGSYDMDANKSSELSFQNFDDLEEDTWGVAGLVLGLAYAISAIYRAGAQEAVLNIKSLIISWIPHVNALVQNIESSGQNSERVLSVGSCLALPLVIAFCRRVELMEGPELKDTLDGYKDLISELLSVKKSGILHQSLLLASCVGAGTLLAYILYEGVQSVEVEFVKELLELFRKCYTNPYPPIIHLGGMLGIVNAMGAGAGILANMHVSNYSLQSGFERKESSDVKCLLLSSSLFDSFLTSLMQEMFLMAQNSDDQELQQYASWAVSFLRHHLWLKELPYINNDTNAETNSKSIPQSFDEDNMVMKLSTWLMHLDNTKAGNNANIGTVISILRCLSRAPRLPSLDWGMIIRRCMRYEACVSGFPLLDSAFRKGALREECIQFSLAHANRFDSLLTFLDELSDLSRFRKLELNLQSCLLVHLLELVALYSGFRLAKLFNDIISYLSSITSSQDSDANHSSFLRISCWKGLYQCLDQASVGTLDYIPYVERCMEVLYSLLPPFQSAGSEPGRQDNCSEEWYEAVRCLGKAPRTWLLNFMQISQEDLVHGGDKFTEVQKKIQVKAKLVKVGSLPLTELGKLKSSILNSESQDIWGVLIEVVAVLQHAEESVKRQWLVDAVEISCISSYPLTALQFVGLLSGSSCKYMPLLFVDQHMVLRDLPVTLTSLLSDPNWTVIAEAVISHLYLSTERIYHWAIGDDKHMPGAQTIDKSNDHMAVFLFQVMHHTCVLSKGYLPLEKQLKIARLVIT